MLIVHLFVSCAHVNLCHVFSSSWCRGLAGASACGSSWTFLFTFLVHPHAKPVKTAHAGSVQISKHRKNPIKEAKGAVTLS